ncbi:MAG: ATP-binding protein [Paracoccus sp. (in: a-proteobacteria)]|uniref:ATP-binding protein n=1 Tax=Paracoccus sp. TaxID=267 RepID=UPI0026DF4C5B|nr:ATP-binding protein [Paracoccus sp. (in: a-proteobacteria)]MDO5622009.1 ATP-binding protein [Paracoccus sp. (in: a-proteobacteria)]
MIWPGSIRGRLLLLAAVWLGAALLAAWLAIGAVLERFVTDRFDAELSAAADTLIAALAVEADGRASLGDPLTDPRWQIPLSGWYWQADQGGQALARSDSLFDGWLHGPRSSGMGIPGQDMGGAALRAMVLPITLPGAADPVILRLTAPQSEINAALAEVRRPLAISLILLGLGLTAASLVQVQMGLGSLRRLQTGLTDIRTGKAETLPLPRVAELQPVVREINALLDSNQAVIARSREHLGNLAHSLKTPLAALQAGMPDPAAQELIARMDRQIGWHLRRARSAAAPGILGHRTPVAGVAEDILLVLRHPMQDRDLRAETTIPPDLAFAGERQDLEEIIGNLTENAVKWARSHIRISALRQGDRLTLRIEDDGPGMAETDYAEALTRGTRLDERGASGSGLGLAIVSDLARLHGGAIRLGRSPLGGLAAEVDLPAA